jgi:hypothetical protein
VPRLDQDHTKELTATDPLVFLDMPPFTQPVAPGRARVWLSQSDGENSFALLALDDGRPVKWRAARDAKGGTHYPVDSGTGCFADAATARLIATRESAIMDRATAIATATVDPSNASEWHAIASREQQRTPDLLDLLVKAGLHENEWANVCIDPATGANLVAFQSGAGDGSYGSWFGYDAADRPIALVTDFALEELADGGER